MLGPWADGVAGVDRSGYFNQYNQGKSAPGGALTTGVDFSNDYEFHVLVSGKHDATGLEYGAHMEFEGDTDMTSDSQLCPEQMPKK